MMGITTGGSDGGQQEVNGGRINGQHVKEFRIGNDAIALLFSVQQWGNRRVADKGEITSDADKAMLHLSKRLIESAEYKTVTRYLYDVKQWVISRSVPSFFREGCYLLRLSSVEEVERYLADAQPILEDHITALCAAYPGQIEEARSKLGRQFNERE